LKKERKEGKRERKDLATKGEGNLVNEEDSIVWVDIDGEKKICTENLCNGVNVYGERLIKIKKVEYRVWDAFRSKLAAAIIKGLKYLPIKYGIKVLYLGASTGTTASHVSDIVGSSGLVFCVESTSRVAREFMTRVATYRSNVIPIIEDARKPNAYFSVTGKVDVVYCDIAQPDQTEIAITNCNMYLKENGYLMLVIKARSIDVTKEPKDVVNNEVTRLERNNFDVKQVINLKPFDKDHAMVSALHG
tara:strand:- start:1920 stop:2660 length:741 start_codon:yes stop_codon:yes gene_type:complete